jgi:hypothetical protein
MFGWIEFSARESEQGRFIQLHYMQTQKGGETRKRNKHGTVSINLNRSAGRLNQPERR